MENNLVVLKKKQLLKHTELSYDPPVPLPVHTLKNRDSKKKKNRDSNRYSHTYVHSSIIINSQKGKTNQCPSTDEWINKMCYTHTMAYYSALKHEIPKQCYTKDES